MKKTIIMLVFLVLNLYVKSQDSTTISYSHFKNGQIFFDEGNVDKALESFNKSIVFRDGISTPSIHYYLIKCYLQKEKYEEIRDTLLKEYFKDYPHEMENPKYNEMLLLVTQLEERIEIREQKLTLALKDSIEKKINLLFRYDNIKEYVYYDEYSKFNKFWKTCFHNAINSELLSDIQILIKDIIRYRERSRDLNYKPKNKIYMPDFLGGVLPIIDESNERKLRLGEWETMYGDQNSKRHVYNYKKGKRIEDSEDISKWFSCVANSSNYTQIITNKVLDENLDYSVSQTDNGDKKSKLRIFELEIGLPPYIFNGLYKQIHQIEFGLGTSSGKSLFVLMKTTSSITFKDNKTFYKQELTLETIDENNKRTPYKTLYYNVETSRDKINNFERKGFKTYFVIDEGRFYFFDANEYKKDNIKNDYYSDYSYGRIRYDNSNNRGQGFLEEIFPNEKINNMWFWFSTYANCTCSGIYICQCKEAKFMKTKFAIRERKINTFRVYYDFLFNELNKYFNIQKVPVVIQ